MNVQFIKEEPIPYTYIFRLKFYFSLLDIDDCSPNPCKNEGVCVDGINSYECKCPKGYAGDNCEISK